MKKISNVQNSLINVHKNLKLQKSNFLLLKCTKRNVKFGKINL